MRITQKNSDNFVSQEAPRKEWKAVLFLTELRVKSENVTKKNIARKSTTGGIPEGRCLRETRGKGRLDPRCQLKRKIGRGR